MVSQLRVQGLRYRLGLAQWQELRQTADIALNAGIYVPSLVDAALDADEWLDEIGAAFEQALKELNISLPDLEEQCCWALLHDHISQIASGSIQPQIGLGRVMEIYYGCKLHEQSTHYAGDSHGIEHLVGAYWEYDDLLSGSQEVDRSNSMEESAILDLNQRVVSSCREWLKLYSV